MKLWQKIDSYITDLPRHETLSKKIARFVKWHRNYNLAQVAQICDVFYGESCGHGIVGDMFHDGVL